MNMQGVTALNNFNLLNYSNNFNSNLAPALDFQRILSTVTQTTEEPEETDTFVSAEQSLREIYPDLKYHVVDASQFTYWNRLDFPTSAFFADTVEESTINELRAWKPKTRTATGYEPWVQRDLEGIQPGLHAVMIHPAVQEKMDNDPEYAKQIVAKIQRYFENDIRTNAAIDPESIKSMSQLVSITEDGEIGFHHTVCDGPSKQENDSKEDGIHKGNKKQHLLSIPQNTRWFSSLPSSEQVKTTPFQYDYSQVYGLLSLEQKRRT